MSYSVRIEYDNRKVFEIADFDIELSGECRKWLNSHAQEVRNISTVNLRGNAWFWDERFVTEGDPEDDQRPLWATFHFSNIQTARRFEREWL